jgi:hypothetical protein
VSNSALESFPEEAFLNSSLVFLVLPHSIRVFRASRFGFYTNLKVIHFRMDSQLQQIGKSAFSGSGLTDFCIPRSVERIDGSAFSEVSFSSISIEDYSQSFKIFSVTFQ